jgi:ABC-type Fe3+/spermidine/putrescine transport system ATPase subunit
MQIELRQLQREVGITFVFVTHDQEEALSMSDRIAVMDKGKVLQVADPRTLYEAPSSRAVASFIGTMNIFEGRVAHVFADAVAVDTHALGRLEAQHWNGAAFRAGDTVLVAIRPENLDLSRVPPGGGSVRCRLISTAFLGGHSQFRVGLEGSAATVTVAVPISGSIPGESVNQGESFHLSWRSDALVLLPRD